MEVKLVSYTMPAPLLVTIELIILPVPINNLPYFEPKLAASATIQKTQTQTSWTFPLPKFADKDPADVVSLKADFGDAASFLNLNGVQSIDCSDISMKSSIKAGMYLIKLILDDGKDKVAFTFSLFVLDPPPVATSGSATAKNETSASKES